MRAEGKAWSVSKKVSCYAKPARKPTVRPRWTSRLNGLTDSEVKSFKLNVHWGVRRGAGNSVDASVPLNTDKQLAKEGNMVGVSLK
jgi:hypothetical protein